MKEAGQGGAHVPGCGAGEQPKSRGERGRLESGTNKGLAGHGQALPNISLAVVRTKPV